ncbi:MAG: PAS domain S-box protein [Sporichthyaceae bacterium]
MERIGRLGAILVLAVSALVLIGWYADLRALTSIAPGYATMKPTTALALAALAGGALTSSTRWRVLAGAVPATLGILTLGEYLLGTSFAVGTLLPGISLDGDSPRMAPATASALTALGLAVISGALGRTRLMRAPAVAAFAIGYLATVGYVYSVSSLYTVGGFTSMAVHTAACVCVISTVLLVQDPDEGLVALLRDRGSAGALARPMLAFLLAGPMSLGWLCLRMQDRGWIDASFGFALLVTSLTAVALAMTWRASVRLRASDQRESLARRDLVTNNRNLEAAVVERTRELDRAADRLSSIVQLAPVGIVELDAMGKLTTCNEQWTVLTGLDLDASRGEGWARAIHPEDLDTTLAGWASCVTSGTAYEATLRFVTPQGQISHVHARTTPIVDAGAVTGHLGTISDISVLNAAQQALRASEETLRLLVDSSHGYAIFMLGATGRIEAWNAGAQRLLGYTEAQAMGRHFSMLYGDDRRCSHEPERALEMARVHGRYEEEEWRYHRDGSRLWANVVITPVLDDTGRLRGFIKVLRDRTEHRRNEARVQGLLDAAPDAILAVDAAGLIHLVNRQTEVLFGYGREALLGQSIDVLVPDHIRASHAHRRSTYFANPTPRPMGAGTELMARRRDGVEFPVDISLSSLETDDGVFVLAAVRDVSERKRIDAERGQLEANLAEEKLNTERARLEAQLHQSQRLESLGQLAGGVAHDFNNLLAGIMNYAGLVSMTLSEEIARRDLTEDPTFVTLSEDVAEITTVAKRAAALTQQLLIFGHREVVKAVVLDLNSVVTDVEKLLRRTIGENVDLVTKLASGLPPVKADRGQLEQVFMNLAVNARDAMPDGGRLQIETCVITLSGDDEPDERLMGLPGGSYVQLAVSDTGTGMSKDVVDRAFEPFFSTKPKSQGSGLGLATVHGIVTQAGGRLFIYSEPGLGTTMRVLLPVAPDLPLHDSEPAQVGPPSTRGRGETVLLVEDEDIVRIPAQRMLSRSGYRVLSAEGTAQALDLVAEHRGDIDLLLTDVVMRGRSGKELADEMCRLRPTIKVVFMSGYSEDMIAHQGVLEDGVNLVEKPFSADALLGKVREVLDGAR